MGRFIWRRSRRRGKCSRGATALRASWDTATHGRVPIRASWRRWSTWRYCASWSPEQTVSQVQHGVTACACSLTPVQCVQRLCIDAVSTIRILALLGTSYCFSESVTRTDCDSAPMTAARSQWLYHEPQSMTCVSRST